MIYKVLIILIIILIFYLINNNLNKEERFRTLSKYSKDFIINDTISNLNAAGYLIEEEADNYDELVKAAENSAFVSNYPYTKYLCDSEDMQMMSINERNTKNGLPTSRFTKNRFFGCGEDSTNFLGLNWKLSQNLKNIANKNIKREVKIEITVNKDPSWSGTSTLNHIQLYGSGAIIGNFRNFNPQPTTLGKKYVYNYDLNVEPNKVIDWVIVNVGNDHLEGNLKVFVENLNGNFDKILDKNIKLKNKNQWYRAIKFPLINKISVKSINSSILGKLSEMGTWRYVDTNKFPAFGGINCDGSNFMPMKKNNNVGTWSSLGMTNGQNFSISFWYRSTGNPRTWRNIVHVTTGGNCCNEGQRQPAIFTYPNSSSFLVVNGKKGNGNWHKFAASNNPRYNPMSHYLITFNKKGFDVYKNGVKTYNHRHWGDSVETDPNAFVYIADQYHSVDKLFIKNMIFWNSELNEVDARLLYENSVPLIKTENKVQLKGKDEGDASDEEKLNTSFTITPGFFLGYFGSMGLNSSYDLQISFKITIKNLHSKWRNILLMSNNNMFAGGKKATHC